MFTHTFILTISIASLFTISAADPSSRYNKRGLDNVKPLAAGMGGNWRCSAYCRYPMDVGSITCRFNETLPPHHRITPENANLPLFDPYCRCLSPYVVNYTPRCIWSLGLFKLAHAAVDLMRNAFGLHVNEPLGSKPCSSDCGALHQFEETAVALCMKQAGAAGVKDPNKACWCTKAAQKLVMDCWFCMCGWSQTGSLTIKAKLDICGGVFKDDPRVTSSAVTLVRPTSATVTPSRATELPPTVTTFGQPHMVARNGTVLGRRLPPPVYVSASAVVSGPRGGPAEGYYDTQNTAIISYSGGRRTSVVWWWSCPVVVMTVLLSFCGVFEVVLGRPY